MPRQSKISREAVFKACNVVRDSGKRVTFDRVYEQMGNKGGSRVVQAYIAEWQEAENKRILPGLPDAFSERIRQLAVSAWDDCLVIARAELEEERRKMVAELEAARVANEQVRQEATLQIRAAEMRAKAAEAALADARAESQQQSELIRAQASELASVREALAAANAKVASMNDELARTRQDTEEYRQNMQAQIERIEEAYRGLEKKSLEDIESARLETRAVRNELEKRLAIQAEAAERRDRENQARITELTSSLASALAESTQHRRRAEQLESECRSYVDLLAEARAELARINARVIAVEEHRRAETERADKLAHEMKLAMERIASTTVQTQARGSGK